jgi:hypothetical protein
MGSCAFAWTPACAFGGSYGPNRFQRLSSLLDVFILHQQAQYDARHPFPLPVQEWAAQPDSLQVAGSLPQGAAQLAPCALEVYLDDFTGAGGLDQTPPPTNYPP